MNAGIGRRRQHAAALTLSAACGAKAALHCADENN
jgi:hypothetical protein